MTQATKPSEKIKSIMKAPSVEQQFKNVLGDNAEPFVGSIIDLYNGDQYLQECEPKQVVMEAMKAATLKLPVNKGLGFAYIVPYKGKNGFNATMQIGYKGYIQLAMRTGQYRIINADHVYEGELKHLNKLTGEINFGGEKKSDKVVGYFAHIEMMNGFSKTLYMTKEDIDKHAKRFSKSYSYAGSPWKTDFDAMAKKTVIRNLLSHYGYLSVEMINAADADIQRDVKDDVEQDTAKKTLDVDDVVYEDYEDVPEEAEEQEKPDF